MTPNKNTLHKGHTVCISIQMHCCEREPKALFGWWGAAGSTSKQCSVGEFFNTMTLDTFMTP